ncbi:MAG: hypothetical protein WBC59_03050 [Phycisphaerae bacterium]
MVPSSVYAASTFRLAHSYDRILDACRRQGISRIAMCTSVTGKIIGSLKDIARWRDRLRSDGLEVFALIYGLGHPFMDKYYDAAGQPPEPTPFYDGPHEMTEQTPADLLLPRGWQYAVNDFGQPVFCNACPNPAAVAGNVRAVQETAALFDEVWYDDDYRNDGDQMAGAPHTSSAACYCDACVEVLSRRVGRKVSRADVLADQALHEQWVNMKTDKLADMWAAICQAAREVNPNVRMGLMIRWGGEERDGLDLAKLLPHMDGSNLLRAGEGHFGAKEYRRWPSPVVEYLSVTYHVGWFPQSARVLSETTYFHETPPDSVRKKVLLALAAGAGEVSYCPCVHGWIEDQNFLEHDLPKINQAAELFADKTAMHRPIAMLRGPKAAAGDRRPIQRVRDRQLFPLLGMAGLCSAVVRKGSWRDHDQYDVLAVTSRAVWDFDLSELGERQLVLDGLALLEDAPLIGQLGISTVDRHDGGRVSFSGEGFVADGLLMTRGPVVVIPYVWQDVPDEDLPTLLADIRRVLGPRVSSAVAEGDVLVMPVHYRSGDRDALMLVNLDHQPRTVTVRLPDDRARLFDPAGGAVEPRITLQADEVRLLVSKA